MSDPNQPLHEPNEPLRDGDSTTSPGPDAAQREWESPVDPEEPVTSTLDDVPWDEDVPLQDLPPEEAQPESQGEDPVTAALGDEGQGDLAPEDE